MKISIIVLIVSLISSVTYAQTNAGYLGNRLQVGLQVESAMMKAWTGNSFVRSRGSMDIDDVLSSLGYGFQPKLSTTIKVGYSLGKGFNTNLFLSPVSSSFIVYSDDPSNYYSYYSHDPNDFVEETIKGSGLAYGFGIEQYIQGLDQIGISLTASILTYNLSFSGSALENDMKTSDYTMLPKARILKYGMNFSRILSDKIKVQGRMSWATNMAGRQLLTNRLRRMDNSSVYSQHKGFNAFAARSLNNFNLGLGVYVLLGN